MGGWIFKKRVNGEMNVSRALGDKIYKPYISSEPDVYKYTLGAED